MAARHSNTQKTSDTPRPSRQSLHAALLPRTACHSPRQRPDVVHRSHRFSQRGVAATQRGELSALSYPGGMPAISRWLSAATPPELRPSRFPHPGGMPAGVALGRNSPHGPGFSAIPLGWGTERRLASGGVAALNHRRISQTLAGVAGCSRPLQEMCAACAHSWGESYRFAANRGGGCGAAVALPPLNLW